MCVFVFVCFPFFFFVCMSVGVTLVILMRGGDGGRGGGDVYDVQ